MSEAPWDPISKVLAYRQKGQILKNFCQYGLKWSPKDVVGACVCLVVHLCEEKEALKEMIDAFASIERACSERESEEVRQPDV